MVAWCVIVASIMGSNYRCHYQSNPYSNTGVTQEGEMTRKAELPINQVMYDWFTLTSYTSDFYALFNNLMSGSNEIKEAKRMQYVGQVAYFDSGSLFVGTGRQAGTLHNMTIITGGLAHEARTHAKEAIKELGANLTRVDIQATIQEPLAHEHDGQWRLFNRQKRNKRSVGWIESKDAKYGSLATVYVGSMKSERFARCYQKGSAASRPLLRLEFVMKGRQGKNYGLSWVSGRTNRNKAFRRLLDWFEDTVVSDYFIPIVEGFDPSLPLVVRQETNTEKWLMTTVLNTFARYINNHDSDGLVKNAFLDIINKTDRIGEWDN